MYRSRIRAAVNDGLTAVCPLLAAATQFNGVRRGDTHPVVRNHTLPPCATGNEGFLKLGTQRKELFESLTAVEVYYLKPLTGRF